MNYSKQLLKSIQKVLRGRAHSAEINSVNNWYDSFEKSDAPLQNHSQDLLQRKEKELLEKIKSRAGIKGKSKFLPQLNWKVAASLILAVSLGALYYVQLQPELEIKSEQQWISFENQTGMIKKIKLPDGSRVALYHHTQIQIAQNFTANRNILLEGQAFFEVRKDSLHPFTVKTKKLQTRVLGTSFLIDTQEEEQETVYVKSGLVEVKPDRGQTKKVSPNEMVQLESEGILVKSPIGKPEEIFAWTENKIVLKSATMAELVQKLEDWYGVKIEPKNLNSNCSISGIYQALSLENTLEVISYSIPINYQIHEKNVSIQFPDCR